MCMCWLSQISDVYPKNPISLAALGLDLMALGSKGMSELIISTRQIEFQGPLMLYEGYEAVISQIPVFIRNVSEGELFGRSRDIANCTNCYNATTREKFWAGYSYQLLRQGGYLSFDTPADPSGNFLVVDNTLNSTGLPKDPLHIPMELELPGNWVLLVGYPGGWDNRERQAGLLALVVVMSCLLSTLLLVMLVNNHRYRALLEAVLPSSLVQQMADKATLKQLALGNGHHMHARTPADCILDMMGEVLGGRLPSIKDVMMVRTTLMQAINIYQPIDIIGSIKRGNMDADVAAALSNLVGQGGAVEERSISAVSSPLMRSKSGAPDPAAWDPDCSTLGTTLRALMATEPGGLQCTTSSARQELEQLAALHTQPSLSSLGAWDDVEQPATGPGSAAAYSNGPATVMVDRLLGIARESWEFDVRQLDVATAGHPLSTLTYYLLHSTGLLDELGINKTRMASIEAAYLPNPYHGQRHVTEVVQGFHIILTQSGMQPLYADPLTQLACYLAAAVHDLDHKGVTNDFLVSSHHQLALLYNDRSPMENHHLTLAFTIMRQPGCHFMHGLPRADQVKLRKKEGAVQGQLSTPGSLCVAPLDDTERALSLQVALKLADLSQLARSLDLHLYWVACLEEECFLQGDLEKAMNLAVSPLFDRSKPGITKSQVGFFEVLVIPLFHSFCSVFTAARPFLMDGLMRNYQ
ncbi:3'5'-cyclic nucleotide phosphodiesterase, partial [Haematococcus lacustris]